jgi:TolA-binding protein
MKASLGKPLAKSGLILLSMIAYSTVTLAKPAAKGPTMEDYNDYMSSSDRSSVERAAAADQITMKTIDSINKLLKSKMSDERSFELYLRLGELHSERHDYLREQEMAVWDTQYKTWQKSDKKGKEPALSTKKSQAELLKAVSAFRLLVTKFPKHPRTDAALYSLAKTLARLGNENSVLYFNQLIKNYPKSPLIPQAYLALGEYYFDAHNVPKAKEAYKSAMKYRESVVYPYAVYKLGWCYYNDQYNNDKEHEKNVRKALAAFKLVIKLSDADKTARKLNLRTEAINDLVMVWAELEAVDEAWAYFSKIGENNAFYDMLERLGNIYFDQGNNEKAAIVYTKLLKEAPLRERNPQVHVKLAKIHDRTGNLKQVVADMTDMSEMYLGSSPWIMANKANADIVKEAAEDTEFNIRRYGTLYHQKGQKSKRDVYQRVAMDLYSLYLSAFPKGENAYEIRYYLADLLFHFKEYERAADEYAAVVKADPKGKYMKDSALNAVSAMNKLDQDTKYAKLPAPGKVEQPIDIPRTKTKLVGYIDMYVGLLPKEKDGHPMRYTAAMVYFEYGHYKEALERFEKLGMELPNTTQGKASVKMILAFYTERKDWDSLVKVSRRFMGDKDLAKGELSKSINAAIKTGTFQVALALEKDKKYKESAEVFLAYQKEFPRDDDADKAVYNAALNYYKIGSVDHAVNAGKLLLSKYPKSKLQAKVMMDLAQTYESLAEFKDAAHYYEAYAKSFPKEEQAPGALYNAGVLYKGLKKYGDSVEMFSLFVRHYSKDNLAADARFEIAELQEKQDHHKSAIDAYEAFIKSAGKDADRIALAQAKIAILTRDHVDKKRGARMVNSVVADLSKDNKNPKFMARTLVAKEAFETLEPDLANYRKLTIKSAKTIERDVQKKQELLVKLASGYEKVINIGSGEYTVASLYRLGEMHDQFAKLLFEAPAPEGVSQVELDQYRSSIEKVAFPLRDESLKFYEGAYKASSEVQTFTDWTIKAYDKMAEISGEKHPKISEKTLDPSYVGYKMYWTDSVAGLVK